MSPVIRQVALHPGLVRRPQWKAAMEDRQAMDRRPNIPTIIGGGRVLHYTRLDERHVPRTTAAMVPYGLAICEVEGSGIFLFTCEDDWMPVFDSWHGSVAEAKRQAACEFEGVESTWEQAPA